MRKLMMAVTAVAAFGVIAGAACAQDGPQKSVTGTDAEPQSAAAKRDAKKALTVVGPWTRATPGGAKNGAVFLEVKAAAATQDRLLSVSGAVAETIEIHTHINDAGIMRMRKIEGIDVPEGGSAKLVPGGDHIMLLGLKQPLKAGETFKLKFVFEKAGAIEADVAVRANSAAHGKGSGSGAH